MNEPDIALVTGANKGLGFETARRLAGLGMTILVGARDRQRGEHATARLREHSSRVHLVPLDVTVEQGAEIIVRLATQAPDDATRGFFNEAGEVPW